MVWRTIKCQRSCQMSYCISHWPNAYKHNFVRFLLFISVYLLEFKVTQHDGCTARPGSDLSLDLVLSFFSLWSIISVYFSGSCWTVHRYQKMVQHRSMSQFAVPTNLIPVNVYTTHNSMHKMWIFTILKPYFNYKYLRWFQIHLARWGFITVKVHQIASKVI